MNNKTMNLIVFCGMLAATVAAKNPAMTRTEMTAALRAGEDITGRSVELSAVYEGVQTDTQGQAHYLFKSQDANTLYLCYFQGTERGREKGVESTFTGSVTRIELNDRDFRDNRIYAVWIDTVLLQP
ncbi:MAG: hypothetical protein WCG03_08945 [Kiritimatiellales bacterium]